MIEVTLLNDNAIQFTGDAQNVFDFTVNDDGDLSVNLNAVCVAFYPVGQWRYVMNLSESFDRSNNTSTRIAKFKIKGQGQGQGQQQLHGPAETE
jgi:hypothetical protein